MKSKVVIYMVNEHPFYLRMVANSIKMVRQYNKTLTIRVFLILDNAKQTFFRDNIIATHFPLIEFMEFCAGYNIELVPQYPVDFEGDESFLFIQRTIFKECQEDSVFHLDGDTFIFGDLEPLFEKYEHLDFVANESKWTYCYPGWDSVKYFGKDMKPFNSGVMIWNNGKIRDWAANLPETSRSFRAFEHPISEFLSTSSNFMGREELSVSVYVAENNLTFDYFDENDALVVTEPADFEKLGQTLIFHTFSDKWVETYYRLNPKEKRIKAKFVK